MSRARSRNRTHPRRTQETAVSEKANNKTQYISPSEDYEMFLEKLRLDFDEKYNNPKPSPSTNLDGFEELIILGVGSFGRVKLVKKVLTSQYFAVKTMMKHSIVRSKKVHHILSEKRVLAAIRFPMLVHLEFSSKDNDFLYLGLQVLSGGELFTYHRKMKKFNERQARFYAMQVFLGFEYLHHMNVLYRDLKLENILLDANGYIKLTDFGFAKKVENRTLTLCGTPEYLPPEIIKCTLYGKSVDWWCFGVFLYEMITGRTPFFDPHLDILMMYTKICDGKFEMPIYFSDSLRDLIAGLLQVDITKRLGCQIAGNSDIKNHDWFHEFNWVALLNQEVRAPYLPTIANIEDTSNFNTERSRPDIKSDVNRHSDIFRDF